MSELSPLDQQDVAMPMETFGESASANRGDGAVTDDEERARLRREAEGKRGQKHDTGDIVEPQAKTKARLEPRRCQKRESAQLLPDLEDEIENATSTEPAAQLPWSMALAQVSVPDGFSHGCECRGHDADWCSRPVERWKPIFQHWHSQFWHSWIALLQRNQGQRFGENSESGIGVDCISWKTQRGIASGFVNRRSMQSGLSARVIADLTTG